MQINYACNTILLAPPALSVRELIGMLLLKFVLFQQLLFLMPLVIPMLLLSALVIVDIIYPLMLVLQFHKPMLDALMDLLLVLEFSLAVLVWLENI